MFLGASKRRRFWYELALYTAWHIAAFNSQAKRGKLKQWETIRSRFVGQQPARAKASEKQSPQQMQAVMAALAGQINRKRKNGAKNASG